MLKQAEELAAKYPNTIPIMLDVGSQEGHLDSLIKDHDLVIRYAMETCSVPAVMNGLLANYQYLLAEALLTLTKERFFLKGPPETDVSNQNWLYDPIVSVRIKLKAPVNFHFFRQWMTCAPQHAALHSPPAHRHALHPEEGQHGDRQLPESSHEGAAEQVIAHH